MQETTSLEALTAALKGSWSADTAFDANEWSSGSVARGQCVVSALVVQDYFGGDLQRYEVRGENFSETHYANLINDTIIDTTISQYKGMVVALTPTSTNLKGFMSIREKRLADDTTRKRYELLKARVASVLNK